MIFLFWLLQALLASILSIPVVTALIGGSAWFNEFAIGFAAGTLWITFVSFVAQMLRINDRPGAGALVLLGGMIPFALLLWYLISFAANWRN